MHISFLILERKLLAPFVGSAQFRAFSLSNINVFAKHNCRPSFLKIKGLKMGEAIDRLNNRDIIREAYTSQRYRPRIK